jgi:hypothetical protein
VKTSLGCDLPSILQRLADIEAKAIGVSSPVEHRGYMWVVKVPHSLYFNEIGLKYDHGFVVDICLGSVMSKARTLFTDIKEKSLDSLPEWASLRPNFHFHVYGYRNFAYPSIVGGIGKYVRFWRGKARWCKKDPQRSLLVWQNEKGVQRVLSSMAEEGVVASDFRVEIPYGVPKNSRIDVVPEIGLSIQMGEVEPFAFYDALFNKIKQIFQLLGLHFTNEPWAKENPLYADGRLFSRFRIYGLHDGSYLTFEKCHNDSSVVKMTESFPQGERWESSCRYILASALENMVTMANNAKVPMGELTSAEMINELDQSTINLVFNGIGWASSPEVSEENGKVNKNRRDDFWRKIERAKNSEKSKDFWNRFSQGHSQGADRKSQYVLRVFDVGNANCSVLLKEGKPIAVFDIGSRKKSLPDGLIELLEGMKDGLFVISHWDCDHINLNKKLKAAYSANFWLLPEPTIRTEEVENLFDSLSISGRFLLLPDGVIPPSAPLSFDAVSVLQAKPNPMDPNQSTKENAHGLLAEINAERTAFIPGDALYQEYPKTFFPDVLIIPHHVCWLKDLTRPPVTVKVKKNAFAIMPVGETGFGYPRYHPNQIHYSLYQDVGCVVLRFDNSDRLVFYKKNKKCKQPSNHFGFIYGRYVDFVLSLA